jgi:UDP-N-acetylmuramoyl-L-alanyl-D-glutamate--2,6-diaminopimelate ligase
VYGDPAQTTHLVGVTGTNGKTSVVTMTAALVRSMGWSAGSIGTLTNVRTTPATPELYRSIASLAGAWTSRDQALVALEVSSHAIDQHRIQGLFFDVAAFTNLSHDHLDYHGDMESYFAAKAALFTGDKVGHAVIWVDDPWGARLAGDIAVPSTVVSRADASEVSTSLTGTAFIWRGHVVNTTLLGRYNVDNALVAMTICAELGFESGDIARAMASLEPVPGRFEVVSHSPVVVVDYAHTPDGLQRVLADLREIEGVERVITVFGCGGDRDRAKRPVMGAVASTFSDVTYVTSDNPRSEQPDAIIDDVMRGALDGRDVRRVVDRRAAISEAIENAKSNDIVLIAGKGHELTQTIGATVIAFDDRAVAREVVGK